MLTKLKLERFKNFKEAELVLGPFTTLIGSNASGKSNLRDAFRFLHGISRGYNLAEIMGEKYIEGGVLQWRGIRGGPQEITYLKADTFALEVEFEQFMVPDDDTLGKARYSIEVEPGKKGRTPKVVREALYDGVGDMVFDSHPNIYRPKQKEKELLTVRLPLLNQDRSAGPTETFTSSQPVLTQISDRIVSESQYRNLKDLSEQVEGTIDTLRSMRFLDLNVEAMRHPSLPGQIILGDRGENLSSVLQAISEDARQKKALLEWVRELTPMDATDFEFTPDQTGRILVTLIEESGRRTSAYSASDGTLRFLAIIAALLGPKPNRFYFFEELDNGLHPSRLYLLLQLLAQKTKKSDIQIVTTTHSPQLLRFLSEKAQGHASLIFRLPDKSEGRIERILNIPDIQQIINEQDLARLHESGWFEDAMAFLDEAEVAR